MADSLATELLDLATRIVDGDLPEFRQTGDFTVGAFDALLVKKRGADAFGLLEELCEMFESVTETSRRLEGYYWLLSVVLPSTGTTEMPSGMSRIIAFRPDLSGPLREWYRVSG